MDMHVHLWMCMQALGDQKTSDLLEFQAVVSHPVRLLGTRLQSSARAATSFL